MSSNPTSGGRQHARHIQHSQGRHENLLHHRLHQTRWKAVIRDRRKARDRTGNHETARDEQPVRMDGSARQRTDGKKESGIRQEGTGPLPPGCRFGARSAKRIQHRISVPAANILPAQAPLHLQADIQTQCIRLRLGQYTFPPCVRTDSVPLLQAVLP